MAYVSLPADGSIFQEGMTVPLVGSAYDPEDGSLDDSQLTWTSSLDGTLGNGELLFAQDL